MAFVAVQDLDRAAVALADAVLVMAPKYAEDAVLADRYTAMVTLAVGQHLQHIKATMRKQALAPGPYQLWPFLHRKMVGLCWLHAAFW
jgi:hypothetical protein